MSGKYDREYTVRHEKIVQKLMKLVEQTDCACFPISKLASELGMDQRTVRSHLKIIEIDNAGVFMDPDEKQFCTREGVALLAKKLGIGEVYTEETST